MAPTLALDCRPSDELERITDAVLAGLARVEEVATQLVPLLVRRMELLEAEWSNADRLRIALGLPDDSGRGIAELLRENEVLGAMKRVCEPLRHWDQDNGYLP